MYTKVCTKCKIEKNIVEFYPDTSRKGGYQHQCKVCRNANKRAIYAAHNSEDKVLRSQSIAIPTTKICSKCKMEKELSEFSLYTEGKYGCRPECKDCKKIYNQTPERKAVAKAYRQSAKGKEVRRNSNNTRNQSIERKQHNREYHYKYLYGISIEDYDRMLEEQNGVCAICGKADDTGKRLAVDHDHTTGEKRGLLCMKCNTRFAHFEEFHAQMNAYLTKYTSD